MFLRIKTLLQLTTVVILSALSGCYKAPSYKDSVAEKSIVWPFGTPESVSDEFDISEIKD